MNIDTLFELAWSSYPRKLGRKQAFKHFKKDIKTIDDFDKLMLAMRNYKDQLTRMKTEIQFVKHASTFFNNWQDYLDMEVVKEDNVLDEAKKIWSFEI